MPVCSICSLSNLYSDTIVFSVAEDVDKYRDRSTGLPRHRICRKCLDEIEARDNVMFHILYTYPSKSKEANDTRDYQERSIRQKIMSKHFRVAEYRRKKAAEEFEVDRKLKERGGI